MPVIAAIALAACSSSSSSTTASTQATSSPTGSSTSSPASSASTQPVSLTLVSYLPLIGTTGKSTLDGLLAGFHAAHPNVTVTVQVPAATNGAAITAVVQRDEAAGNTPDVVQSGLDMLRYLVTGLGAQSLTSIAGAPGIAAEWGGPHPYPASLQALGQVNGQLYAIPWVLSTPVLFYNAKLFTKAGLNPSDPPKTWAQVQSDALTIKQKTGADGLSSCAAGESSVEVDWCTQAMIRSNGGTIVDAAGKTLSWTAPKTVAAIAELGTLGHAGALVNLTTTQAVEEFSQGKLAMVLNSSAAQHVLEAGNGPSVQLESAELPGFGSAPSVPTNSGSALAILSKTPAKQQAAWQLIQWLTTDAAYTTITKEVGYAPLRTSLATGAAAQALEEPNLQQLSHLVAWQDYSGSSYAQVEQLLEDAVSGVAFQGQSAASALSKAQSQAQSLLGS